MTQRMFLLAGAGMLAALWLGPLPEWARHQFSAHMLLHMGVVAVAAPLIAIGSAGRSWDLTERWPALFNPIVASVFELAVVWAWHAPAFHHAARTQTEFLLLEQASFLAAGLWLWLAACGGTAAARTHRAWSGVAGLLFTSIHMTLLGALFALAPRTIYSAHLGAGGLGDQHLGGSIMLLIGGASYLAGGLWLTLVGLRAGAIGHRSGVA
ncbi:MAG TPA: cytochrome c oxidase assembly protein [Vicinamibacterales bacterium]|nr:cytochrome c oxidase assembly protein [Vicinamibacterales bacterium]